MPRTSEPPSADTDPPPTQRYPEGAVPYTPSDAPESDTFDHTTVPPLVPEADYVAAAMATGKPSQPAGEHSRATVRAQAAPKQLSTLPAVATLADPNARGGALSLVKRQIGRETRSSAPAPGIGALDEMRARFDVGDFSGALPIAEQVLKTEPANADARRIAEASREALRKMYVSRLGGWKLIPRVIASADQFRWLSMDHHNGFLLSLVDGRSSVEELVDVSGMPPLQALRILVDLLEHSVIQVR